MFHSPICARETGHVGIGPSDGVLFSTTSGGGTRGDYGTIFALQPPASPGGPWTEIVLHRFTGSDGASPYAGVVIGGGVLYGTTNFGGSTNDGTVFSLTQ